MSEVLGLHTTWRDRADYLRGVLFCAVLLGVALVYSFQLTSFLHAKEALLSGALLALAGLACFRGGAAFQGITAYLPLWGMVVFTLLAAHPRVPSRSVEEALRIASLLFAAALVHDLLSRPYWRGRIKQAIMVSAALVAGLGIAQYFGGLPTLFPVFPGYDQRSYSVFGNQDLLGGYLAIALPLYVAGWTTEKPGSRAAVFHNAPAFALVMGGLILSGSRSAWAAAFLGSLLVFPYRRCFHRRVLSMICIVLAASVASGAAVWPRPWERLTNTFAASDTGGRIRLWIWDGTLRMLRDAPWSGVGLGNYAYWSPRYLGEALNAPGGERHAHNELDTPDAHSEPLQCLAESGVIGLVGMAWMLLRLMRRRGPEWGGLAALLVFSCFNAAWHSAPHALAGLLLAGMLLQPEAKAPLHEEGAGWAGGLSSILIAVLLAVASAWTIYVPSFLQCRAEAAHCAGNDPLPLYNRVFAHGWPNPQCHEEAAMALLDAERFVEAREHLHAALDGLDTGRAYQLLAVALEASGDLPAAQEAHRACLERWPGFWEAWIRLYLAAPEAERAEWREYAKRWGITAETSAATSPP